MPQIDSTPTTSTATDPSWQRHMREAFRSVNELCDHLGIDAGEHASLAAADSFPLFAPRPFVSRMRHGDAADPLLLQVLPVAAETDKVPDYSSDPLSEKEASLRPGLLQKYDRRVLLITTGACAIHCRYCFRRHFPYSDVPHSTENLQPSLDMIAKDESIEEVILSGGDPLAVPDQSLDSLVGCIEQIEHVQRLRFHTRLPIMIPERVDSKLIDLLETTRLQTVFVLHANHAAEIDNEVSAAITRLRKTGGPVLNQSVLLRGVNNSVDLMEDLCRQLINVGVIPYYMHQLDRVDGAAHFEVPKDQGQAIIEQLRSRLPGYAVPRFVEERAGDRSKRPIS
ncbi:EF-P beta-lysylation protein EpmB [Planctomycetota bacterium]